MIVIDSSALVAILIKESEGPRFTEAIRMADHAVISEVNVHETGIVLRMREGQGAIDDLYDLLSVLDVEIVPFGEADCRQALQAFERYGKGIDPMARLNLSDCVAYALAKSLDAPLLFKGDDFAHTDLRPCP